MRNRHHRRRGRVVTAPTPPETATPAQGRPQQPTVEQATNRLLILARYRAWRHRSKH